MALAPFAAQKRHSPDTPATRTSTDDGVESASASASSLPDLSSTSMSPDTTTTFDSHISHRPYTSASIPDVASDVTSLHLQHLTRQQLDTEFDDMAALPALAQSAWSQPHGLHLGLHDVAQRERDWLVLDHIDKLGYEGLDRAPKHDLRVDLHTVPAMSDHEDMEARLRRYEQEVLRLRGVVRDQGNNAIRHEPHSTPSEAAERTRAENVTTSASDSAVSPAALLQLQHERAQLQQSCLSDVAMIDAPEAPLCGHDFPNLQHAGASSPIEKGDHPVVRKPLYADIASQSTDVPEEAAHATTTCSCAGSKATAPSETSSAASPSVAYDHGSAAPIKAPLLKRDSPRFAQPTAAFSRRADETIRKDTTTAAAGKIGPPKPASMTATGLRQQKRKSLPGDWLACPPERTTTPTPTTKPAPIAVHHSSQIEVTRAALRKKPSTYMSPTKAATQRTIATIGPETATPTSLRVQRSLLKLDIQSTFDSSAECPQSCPASPETTIETEVRPEKASLLRFKVIARRRSTITAALPHSRQLPANTSIADLLAQQAKAAGLPMVANTTTKRRGSHGHLLIPIKAKLDKIGILRVDPHAANVRKNSQLLSPISQKSEPELFSPSTRNLNAAKEVSPKVFNVQADETHARLPPIARKVVVAPHVRAAMREAAAREAAATAAAEETSTTKTPSLRATAQEFRPMLRQLSQNPVYPQSPLLHPECSLSPMGDIYPQSTPPQLIFQQSQDYQSMTISPPQSGAGHSPPTQATMGMSISNDDAARFYNAEEWSAIPVPMRRHIRERRSQLKGGFGDYPGHFENVHGVDSRSAGDLSTVFPDVFSPKPISVQAGQVLVPHIDPATQQMRWTLQSGGEPRTTTAYGRETASSAYSRSAANTSPSSSYTSPQFVSPRTPGPLPRSWTIGSEQARQVYGWKGGDGREIKFVGHGPDAEREPANGVRFDYQRRGSNIGRGPRMIGENDGDDSPEVPLAPRSRRHWAQLAGHTKQPCDNMEIVDAVEQIPATLGGPLFGHCTRCAISSH